jgi:hypothetical protein
MLVSAARPASRPLRQCQERRLKQQPEKELDWCDFWVGLGWVWERPLRCVKTGATLTAAVALLLLLLELLTPSTCWPEGTKREKNERKNVMGELHQKHTKEGYMLQIAVYVWGKAVKQRRRGLKDKDTIVKIRNAENGEELDDIAYRERSNAKSRPSLFFWWKKFIVLIWLG